MVKYSLDSRWMVAAALAVGACAEDPEGESQGSESTGAICSPGQEGCPCAAGNACVVGLVCVSNACIDPSGVSSGASGSGGTTSGGGSGGSSSTTSGGSGDPGGCAVTDECATDQICVDGYCAWIGDLWFEVTVHEFSPPECTDGWGGAELYYDYFQGGEYVSSSAISGCPGLWSDEVVFYDSLQSFQLSFWDSDALEDDLVTSLCWGGDGCEGVPFSILRQGWWAGLDGSGVYYVSLSFAPVTAVGVSP